MNYSEGTPQYGLRKLSEKYGASIIFLTFSYICLGFVLNILFRYILLFLTGDSVIDTETDIGYAEYMFLNSFVSYTPLFVVFSLLFRRENRASRGFLPYPKIPGETVILFFAGGCIARAGALITSVISAATNALFDIPVPEAAFSDSISQNVPQFITFEVFGVVVAPVCEELIYRHLLLRPMRKFGDMQAAVITGLLFGLGHFNFDQFLYTFMFGFALAVVAIRRNSVIPAIIIHMINNLLAGLSSYLPETFGNDTVDSIFDSLSMISDLSGLLILYGGAVAVIIAVVTHLFTFREPEYMTDGEEFGIIFRTPTVIVGIIMALALAFLVLYI